jgi:hypothetical protein
MCLKINFITSENFNIPCNTNLNGKFGLGSLEELQERGTKGGGG